MPKQDCKYWDKCYQKNEQHLQKYNHPERKTNESEKLNNANDKNTEELNPPKNGATNVADEATTSSKETPISSAEKREHDIESLRTEVLGNIAGKNYMESLQKRIKLSELKEYDDLLCTNEFIRHKFLVEMPPDFYAFWKFASELKKDLNGQQVLEHFEKQFQLQLVGPFEFLAGRFHNTDIREPGDYLRHWRFYYDPPEFQTIFVRCGTGIHYGYWRDEPHQKEKLLLARNDAAKSCEFEFIAGNAFDAFLYFIEKDFVSTPFNATLALITKKAVQKCLETLEIDMENLEVLRKARNSKVVTKTFHRAGIVVPYEGKTQVGYRPLIVSDAELRKILKVFEIASAPAKGGGVGCGHSEEDNEIKKAVMIKLDPIITAANIATDECDFGTLLELGIDLFCSGYKELHVLIISLLVPAYSMLNRPQFIAISKAHLEKRRKDFDLSLFKENEKQK